MAYRTTKHTTTGVSPAKLFFGREVRCKLPKWCEMQGTNLDVKDRDGKQKQKYKDSADTKRRARESDIESGDKVLLQQQKQNKLTTPYETVPYDVVERHGTQVTIASPEGVRYRRNISQVKRFLEPDPVMVVPQSPAAEDPGGCETDTSSATHTATTPLRGAIQTPVSTAVPQAAATPVRPSRNHKPPSRFKDFVID